MDLRSEVGRLNNAVPPNAVFMLSVSSVLLLGLIDFLTGPQLAFSVFYLLPLSLVAWKVGFRRALLIAVVAAITWLEADIAAGQEYGHFLIPIWNTGTRFGVFVLVAWLLHRLRDALEVQEHLARTDSLTGVVNGRAFAELAQEALDSMRKMRKPLTMAYLDLDNFKSINDNLGHNGGDEVLRAVAVGLTVGTRGTDVVGRLGGDEFGLVLPETDSRSAEQVMTMLIPRVQASLSAIDFPVTFSAGAVTYLAPPKDLDEMIRTADELMYEAKRAGKATYRHVTVGGESSEGWADEGTHRIPFERASAHVVRSSAVTPL